MGRKGFMELFDKRMGLFSLRNGHLTFSFINIQSYLLKAFAFSSLLHCKYEMYHLTFRSLILNII